MRRLAPVLLLAAGCGRRAAPVAPPPVAAVGVEAGSLRLENHRALPVRVERVAYAVWVDGAVAEQAELEPGVELAAGEVGSIALPSGVWDRAERLTGTAWLDGTLAHGEVVVFDLEAGAAP